MWCTTVEERFKQQFRQDELFPHAANLASIANLGVTDTEKAISDHSGTHLANSLSQRGFIDSVESIVKFRDILHICDVRYPQLGTLADHVDKFLKEENVSISPKLTMPQLAFIREQLPKLITKETSLRDQQKIMEECCEQARKKGTIDSLVVDKLTSFNALNVESRLFLLMEKDLKQAHENLKGFIHPLCSDRIDEKVANHKLVLEKVLEFLNDKNARKKVLLILGNAGSGKSSCCQMILRLLWARFNSTEIGNGEIPLFASLPSIPNPSEKVVSETLGRAGIHNPEYQTWLRENRIVHFILDGYDELFDQVKLFSQSMLESFNGKIIISCRNEALPDLKILSPKNCDVSTLYLASFTETQSIEYVTNQTNTLLVHKFKKIVASIPSMKDFIQIPFHLKIILEILPEITKKLNENNSTLNRYELYELFIRTRIDQAIENQVGATTSSKTNLTGKQLPDAVIQQCIEWSIQMRNQNSTSLSFDASKSKIDKELQALAGLETKEQLLKWLSPLLLEENGNIVNCRFIHSTIGEFFLVFQFNQILSSSKSTNQLKIEIQKHPIFSQLLGISTWQFICDLVKSNEKLNEKIWNFIELSKESNEFSIVAANCASIWNICGFSFSGKDLSKIKIPGAYLNGANLFGIDLRNSNLKGCQLKNAVLMDTNFEGADMSNVLFGESSIWKVSENIFSFDIISKPILYQNHLVFRSVNKLEIWDYSARKLKFVVSESDFSSFSVLKKKEILVVNSWKQQNIQFWELKTGNLISKMNVNVKAFWFSPDENFIFIVNEESEGIVSIQLIEMFEVNDFKTFKSFWTKNIGNFGNFRFNYTVQFSHHNQFLILQDRNKCIVLNSLTGETIESFYDIKGCFVSEDGHELVMFKFQNLGLKSNMERIDIFSWNLNSKSTTKAICESPFRYFNLSKSFKIPNRNEILYYSQGKFNFFDLSQLKVISQSDKRTIDFSNHLFSEDGSLLAIFFKENGLFCLIDLKEHNIVHNLHHSIISPILLDVTAESITILDNDTIRVFPWTAKDIDLQVNDFGFFLDLHLMEESNQLFSPHLSGFTFWDLKTKQISYAKHYFLQLLLVRICRCGPFFALALRDNILIGNFVKMNFKEVKSLPISNVTHMTSNGNQMIICSPLNQRNTQIWRVYESSTWEIKSQFTTTYNSTEDWTVILAKDSIIVNLGNAVSILNFQGEQISGLLTDFNGVIKGISPDSKFLLVRSVLSFREADSEIVEIETRKAEVLKESKWTYGLCWSEIGKYFLILNGYKEIQIWDWRTRTLKKSLKISFAVHSICASKDFSEIFVGSIHGSIWNFKIVGLDTDKIHHELIWVHRPSFTATNANLKGTTISNENLSILENYGAIKESSSELSFETTQFHYVENEDFEETF